MIGCGLGSEEGLSFPVGDELTEAAVGGGVTAWEVP